MKKLLLPFLSIFLIWFGLGNLFCLFFTKYEVIHFVNGMHSSELNDFFKYITYPGDGLFSIYMALMIAYFVDFKKGCFVLVNYLVTGLIAQLIKRLLNFPRPSVLIPDFESLDVVNGIVIRSSYSFPSGHTTTIFALMLALIIVMNKPKWGFIAAGIAIVVGFSRVYLFQHHLIDILYGGLLATVLTPLFYLVFFYPSKVKWYLKTTKTQVYLKSFEGVLRSIF